MTVRPDSPRRSERARTAIVDAAWDLCREQSYARVTMDGIASRAGVGKTTIYRWWPSKTAVILDAMMARTAPAVAFAETGDPVADLRTWLRRIATMLADPNAGPVIAGLAGSLQHDPALAQAWHERVYLPTRAASLRRVHSLQEAGLLQDDDPEIVADLLYAPMWFRLLLGGGNPSPEHADAIVTAVLRKY